MEGPSVASHAQRHEGEGGMSRERHKFTHRNTLTLRDGSNSNQPGAPDTSPAKDPSLRRERRCRVIKEITNDRGKMKSQYRFKKFAPNSIVILIIALSTAIAAIPLTLLADDYQIRKARADADWQAKRLELQLQEARRERDRFEAEMREAKAEIEQAELGQQIELNRLKREQEMILQRKEEEKRLNDLKEQQEAERIEQAKREIRIEKLYAKIESFTVSLEQQTERNDPLSENQLDLSIHYGRILRSSIEDPNTSELIDIIRFSEEKFKFDGGPPLSAELNYFKQRIRRDMSLFNRLKAIDAKNRQLIGSQEDPNSTEE